MAKASGGTRNYRNNSKVMNTRKSEYEKLMSSGEYDIARSYFDKSGGFVATHNWHNSIRDSKADKSDVASLNLSKKGYKVYLDSEKSTIEFKPNKDGRIYNSPMDIKTISNTGKNTIKGAIESASKQGANVVVLYQNTSKMDKKYVLSQLELFKTKSPQKAREKIDWVFVIGSKGSVHRHKMKIKR